MSDRFVEGAKDSRGTIERLLKGLPGIRGYVDKEMRRDADKRLRDLIARELEEQKQALFAVQQQMLRSGGLRFMATVDGAIQKLQILVDRVKTASYGYAGLFDTVNIQEEQLNALYRFDVALANRIGELENAVVQLGTAFDENNAVDAAIDRLTNLLIELNTLFGKRNDAIVNPDLLLDSTFVPEVPADLLDMDTESRDS
ncbi:MAG: hypothetical protein WDZ49_16890 [Litorilinea sp.]